MNKWLLVIGSAFAGCIIGIAICVYLFAIDIDLLAVPYLNRPVVLNESVEITQGGIQTILPKGTKLVHVKTAFETDEMYVPVAIPWKSNIEYLPLNKRIEYFYPSKDKILSGRKEASSAGKK
jgi:hypothetical protein